MNQFNLIQYGYLGLLAFTLIVSSQLIKTYITASNPPQRSIFLLVIFFSLSVLGGVFGYLWAAKDLEASQKRNITAATIQQEISNARSRLNSVVGPLYTERNKALQKSVEMATADDTQQKFSDEAMEISNLIREQESRYQDELVAISRAFSSLDNHALPASSPH